VTQAVPLASVGRIGATSRRESAYTAGQRRHAVTETAAVVAETPAAPAFVPLKKRYIPLDNRILLLPDEAISRSEGGIILPPQAQARPLRARVIAVGEGKLLDDGKRAPMRAKLGDHVIHAQYAGTLIELEGQFLKVMREDEALLLEPAETTTLAEALEKSQG